MLSLDKTKSPAALADFLGTHAGVMSWKMDGLTVVLTYRHGKLFRAVTRGNGEIGEVVTSNALVFKNLPKTIAFDGELVLRGEAVIRYSDFERINSALSPEEQYKNPRNLCSGAVRQLNSRITAERSVNCFIFALISKREMFGEEVLEGGEEIATRSGQFEYLRSLGFETVEYEKVDGSNVVDAVKHFAEKIETNDFPSDGLVVGFEDIAYGRSLGRTAKFPRDSIAFKWADETCRTKLIEVEWSASRTGLINPVAVFEPVELEGTTVTRASVHNVSIVRELKLGVGDEISVYKANMIIPQIAENFTRSGTVEIPAVCPVCGGKTEIRTDAESSVLICTNPDCQAKKIKAFALFVSRDAMNIEGMSESTIERLIAAGCVHRFADLFALENHREAIIGMDGFGVKSYENLVKAAEKAKDTTLSRIIYSLGIAGVGLSTARLICRFFSDNADEIIAASPEHLMEIEGIGEVTAHDFAKFFENSANVMTLRELIGICRITTETVTESAISGKTFVITGSVEHYSNRAELKTYIESLGGKVAGSVSSKTDYLINNDATSNSTKNKTAKELGVAVITEEEFIALVENR